MLVARLAPRTRSHTLATWLARYTALYTPRAQTTACAASRLPGFACQGVRARGAYGRRPRRARRMGGLRMGVAGDLNSSVCFALSEQIGRLQTGLVLLQDRNASSHCTACTDAAGPVHTASADDGMRCVAPSGIRVPRRSCPRGLWSTATARPTHGWPSYGRGGGSQFFGLLRAIRNS
jgi:hypothetical protein